MSESIGFENFRIFEKEVLIDLTPITILTGPNSSGKSSVIKAAKLLKQNICSDKYSGLPISLSFTPDDFGHNLASFNQICNRASQSSDISFTIPINLETLGNDFHGKITYGIIDEGNKAGAITLNSFSIFQTGQTSVQLARIKGALGGFYDMEINPILVKSCLEEHFLKLIGYNLNPQDALSSALLYSNKKSLPGQDILSDLLNSDEKYFIEKPIMPWYNLFVDDIRFRIMHYEKANDPVFNIRFQRIVDHYHHQIELFRLNNDIQNTLEATYQYFQKLEIDFFNFINDKKLDFPIDLSISNRNTLWWNGILFNDYFDKGIETSINTVQAILDYDSNLAELMYIYENAPSIENYHVWQNNDVFNHYLQYIILESIEQCRSYINDFRFADLNRIEQVLLYSNANSSTAFKILNDYLRSEKLVKSKIVEHLSKIQIAEDFVIEQGNGAYQINLLKQNSWVPLAEMGFGISKIFFFLLTLSTYKLVFIEEPESNLHPDLQSKLADILQSFSSSNTKFIIETHSEYLIRKFQYMVATNNLSKDDIIIHYFNPEGDKNKTQPVKSIRINRDGSLDGEFGRGFYDEASNIIRDLFNLTVYN